MLVSSWLGLGAHDVRTNAGGARINGRSRQYEQAIPAAYLEQLNRRYEEWLRRFEICPVLTIETDTLDFAHDVAARREVVDMIAQAAGVRGMMQERMMT